MDIRDWFARLTQGQDPNQAIVPAAMNGVDAIRSPSEGAFTDPNMPGSAMASSPMDAQAALPPIPQGGPPRGIPSPVTNPQPQNEAPKVTQSPPDLANMYVSLMKQNQNAQAMDSGLTLIAAGLSRNPNTRQALIQSSAAGGGKGGMSLSASDIINFDKQRQAAQDKALRQSMLGGLMKQYKMTPEQIQYLETSGALPEVLKHYSTENLGITEDSDTGKKILFNQRSGQQLGTLGGEKPDPTQVVKTPLGEQVINMRTGEKVGGALGPTDPNVSARGTKYPGLDTGFDYERDNQGMVKEVDGKPVVAPIHGSKAEKEQIEAQQKKVDQKMQATAALSSVTNAIGLAEKAMDEAFVPGAVGVGSKLYNMTVGQLGGMAGNVIRDNIDTVKANATFDKLAAMRQASPTGGALGSVSDFENKLLGAATATLSPNLTESQLRENMYRVQATMELLADKKYTDEKTFDTDVKKRVSQLKTDRTNRMAGDKGITVTRD